MTTALCPCHCSKSKFRVGTIRESHIRTMIRCLYEVRWGVTESKGQKCPEDFDVSFLSNMHKFYTPCFREPCSRALQAKRFVPGRKVAERVLVVVKNFVSIKYHPLRVVCLPISAPCAQIKCCRGTIRKKEEWLSVDTRMNSSMAMFTIYYRYSKLSVR